MIDLFNVSFGEEIKKIVLDTIDSKAIAAGPYINQLENKLSEIFSGKFSLAVNDMTNGMMIVLDVLGISKGDEVIVSPFSCLATTSPLALLGVKPVWADVDHKSLAIDVQSVKNKITSKTKAILIYHVAGYPSDTEALADLAKENNLLIIEDCNSAFGTQHNNILLGSLADATVLSFYPNRQVGSIDGGGILFKEKHHYELAKLRRRYGVDFNCFRKENGEINELKDVSTYGYSATMNNISAGIINNKIDDFQSKMCMTERNVTFLDEIVKELHSKFDNIKSVVPINHSRVNHWVYFVEVTDKEAFLYGMKERNVHVSSLHLRNDLYSCFAAEKVSLPGIDKIADSIVALPCGHWLNNEDMQNIATALFETVSSQVN